VIRSAPVGRTGPARVIAAMARRVLPAAIVVLAAAPSSAVVIQVASPSDNAANEAIALTYSKLGVA
jgi:hypothetical protein